VPQIIETNIPMVPPSDFGLYMVPARPQAWAPMQVTVKSAVYVDLASVRTSVSGNLIRFDFDFHGDAPVGSVAPPAGSSSFASAGVPNLAPGAYRVEGWGRAIASGDTARYFIRDFVVAEASPVVEFYSPSLDHYFMSALPAEVAALDSGAVVDWRRTGQQFSAWLFPSDAPINAKPVCRFFSIGANSHFYAGDPGECSGLRDLEARQRAEAAAQSRQFTGWQYEGIAFYSVAPVAGACPAGMDTIYRAYNNRWMQDDSNHRFTVDPVMRAAMLVSWVDEGAAFCSPR
jgi:hypothetical protein